MKHTRILAALMILLLLAGPVGACADILKLPMDFSGGTKPQRDYEIGLMEYEDPSIHVVRQSERPILPDGKETRLYVLRVKIADASQLRTVSMQGFDKRGRVGNIEIMANRVNAVVAFNGDYFCGDAKRYVLRQGTVFKESMGPNQDILLIDEDGDFHVLLAEEHPEEMDKTQINGKKVVNALCFGPALIKDGVKNTNLDTAPPLLRAGKENRAPGSVPDRSPGIHGGGLRPPGPGPVGIHRFDFLAGAQRAAGL